MMLNRIDIKKQRHYFANKGSSSQGYDFSSGHVWMWELDYKESWALKNWCCWTVVLEKTLESPLDCKEIQPVHPKGDQSWVFFGRNDVEAETLILWPPDAKTWLIGKDPDAGKDWRWQEKGMTEDEMVGRHHWLNGHGFGWTLGVGDGQGSLVCCGSWGHKESDTTERLDWTELSRIMYHFSGYWITQRYDDTLMGSCLLYVCGMLLFSPLVVSDPFATPLTAVRQASLSFTISWNLLKLMSIESVMFMVP